MYQYNNTSNKLGAVLGMIVFTLLLLPVHVWAQGAQVDVFNQSVQLAGQASAIPRIISIGLYVVGAFFVGRSLFALRGFIQNPDDNPVTGFLGFGAVGALMIVMPYAIALFRNAIMGDAVVEQQLASADSFASQQQLKDQMTQ